MDSFDIIEKYFKLMNEEKNFNYKYNPILNSTNTKSLLFNKPHLKLNNSKKIPIRNKNTKNIFSIKNNIIKDIDTKKLFSKTSSDFKRKIKITLLYPNMDIPKEKKYNIKHFYIKNNCPCCKKNLTEKEDNPFKNMEKVENFYRNKNFKDIKSCFIYSVNNFPLINIRNNNINSRNYFKEKINDEMSEKHNNSPNFRNKKIDMESELTKRNRIIKYKEIQRKEFDPSNLYLVKKPLIPSIRAKILRYTKQRFEKPMRVIFIDDKDYEDYFMDNY